MPRPWPPRALQLQRALRLALLGVLLVAASGLQPQGAAGAAAEWVEVLREDDAGVELLLRSPAPTRDGATLRLPGFARGGDPGLPVVYAREAYVGVPGPGGARMEVLDTDVEALAGAAAEIVKPPGFEADPLSLRRTWRGLYPANPVALAPGGRLRGREIVTLRFTPLQFEAGGGATRVRAVRVRLVFADRPRPAPEPVREVLHTALLNATSAARWALAVGAAAKAPAAVQELPAQRLRIRIPRTGIYQLPYDRLQSMGVPVTALDPTMFRLFFDRWGPIPLFADSTPSSWQQDYALQEAALWVAGEANHFFELGDRIVFYALGPREYLDLVGTSSDSLLYGQHPYDTANYAWLVWDPLPGAPAPLRMPAVPASVTGTPSSLVTHAWQRLHFEEDRGFSTVDDLWYWEEIRATRPARVDFTLDLGGDPAPLGEIRIGIGSDGSSDAVGRHVVDVIVNGDSLPPISWSQPVTLPPPAYFTYSHTLQATNWLQLARSASSSVAATFFLKFDVAWERRLALPGTGTEGRRLRWSRRPAGADETYELGGFDSLHVLDVTDPLRPVRLVNPTRAGSFWRLRYGRGAGVRTHFHAVETPALVPTTDLSLRTVPPLRAASQAPDYLIVVHPRLRAQADRLAAHRVDYYPEPLGGRTAGLLVVDTDDVYDNFSGGRVDPLAIRNFAKLLYDLPPVAGEPQTRLRYLLLFGEATHDPRRLQPGSTETLVPTVQSWYADRRTLRAYAVDDWLAEMESPGSSSIPLYAFPVPDLAVGRITPRTTGEAERIVDKFIAFDTSTDYGAWRNRVLLTADDECTPTHGCFQPEHIGATEELVPYTPPEWDLDKIYLTEYPKILGQKPQARAAFVREWSAGCALVNYVGHGAPRQLADEVLFLGTDVPSLVNGTRLPLFAALSCTVSEFDATEAQSMNEDMILSAGGGAMATMGATQPTYSGFNERYNIELWRALFPSVSATAHVALGMAHQLAKNRAPNGLYNETYVLLGDPAMTLLGPEAVVTFSAGADSLAAGKSAHVEGFVHAPGDTAALAAFDGRADVEVFGTADDSGYDSAESSLHIAYDLLGPPFYRGTVDVHGGRLRFDFVVPLGARLGAKARVSAYAYDAGSGRDAKGAVGTVRVVRAGEPDSSLGPPRITLRFPNNLTRVKAGTPLLGEIHDENGINIQGTTLPSSILLDFDAQNQPLNVTALFRYADGSDSVGTLQVPLPEALAPGRHTATLIASDNLQNRASAALEFEVIAGESEQLTNVIAFPNPFKDRTFFFFEITDPADVVVRVYTSAGREVWRTSRFVAEPQQVQIRWDGVDSAQDELANGTYLYQVEARPRRPAAEAPAGREGPILRSVGKVVIMRE